MKRTPLQRRTPLKTKKDLHTLTHFQAHKPKKRRVKTDLQKAKDKLWELCKLITRARYGNVCFTCDKPGLEGGNWQTGHFITDSTCSTELSYDLNNLRPQCYHCNINLSGTWEEFEHRLTRIHGAAYVQELKDRNRATKGLKYDILWYQRKIDEYESLLTKL